MLEEVLELEYIEALNWYWDLIMLGSWALADYQFEDFEFYEDWRRAIKGAMIDA